MKVCCISAKARHGKDTAADIIKEYLESNNKKVLITHYADLLKFICTNFFNWNGEKDEKGRSLLQHIGTDVVCAKDQLYWVKFVVGVLNMFENEWDYVLIPDCRYPFEVAGMKDHFDTCVLRVERPNFENNLTAAQRNHASEISMDNYEFDYTVSNDAGLEELKEKLKVFTDSYLLK